MSERFGSHYSGFIRQYMERVETYLANLEHAGQKGTVSERAVVELLRDFLPTRFVVEHDAVLVDIRGELSRQCDLAVTNPSLHPRMFPMKGATMLPVDSCVGVLEVKANASKADLEDAFDHARNIKTLHYNSTVIPAPTGIWGLRPDIPTPERPAEALAHTTPPIHVLWCWKTRAKSIRTVFDWLYDTMSSGKFRDFQTFPDMVMFLDKGFLWKRDYILAGLSMPSNKLEDVMQAAHFEATDDDPSRRNVSLKEGGESVQVSLGMTILHFLWTLLPKLEVSEALTKFDPVQYMGTGTFQCRTWPISGTFYTAPNQPPEG